ncbi:TolB family protein [Desulfosudis oleivorans]|uniref:WD40 domain protein beta propeller n=1 Tax=Desulfosudis oleivorans (strain DSM 6200 / JCM 39069 / Hxd3) TaxID=96561 RepID=A8ZZP7_DESOH|nr:PD40 domain-containing protein [Desulfosudis oleivorans]ABW68919.1 WD40 domain protein beta propeller [Desulfosudis oleivorans Hxd3]
MTSFGKMARLAMTTTLFALLVVGQNAVAGVVAEGSATLESLHTDGTQGNDYSDMTSISADGRFIAFESSATTLVDTTTYAEYNILLRDTAEGVTTLISVTPAGYGANNSSRNPAISGDGRYVAFDSQATNLTGQVTGDYQIFMRDTVAGTTQLISPNYGGVDTGAPYGYGGGGRSGRPSVSFDGRYVAFYSDAANLTADSDTFGSQDVFIRDTQTGTTTRIMAYGGAQPDAGVTSPAISGDGLAVAFQSDATNLLAADNPDGSYVNIFVYDTASGVIEMISRAYGSAMAEFDDPTYGANGTCRRPSISYGGRYVAFESYATNLVDGGSTGNQVFVYDRTTGDMVIASAVDGGTAWGNSTSETPAISSDGRYVAFRSTASNLVDFENAGVAGAYLRDTVENKTTLMSRRDNIVAGYDADAVYGAAMTYWPAVSAGGMYVTFGSDEDTLVAGDENSERDIFRVLYDTDGDGIADSDSDGDGTPDCTDLCPDDPNKIDPGACGCGVADTDADGNGIADCLEDDEPEPAPRLPDTDIGPDCFISTLVF